MTNSSEQMILSFAVTFVVMCVPMLVVRAVRKKPFTPGKAKLISILYGVAVFAIYFGILAYTVYTTQTYITPPNIVVFAIYTFLNYKILSHKTGSDKQ